MQYLNIVKLKDLSNRLVGRHNDLTHDISGDKYSEADKVEVRITMDRILARQSVINDIINCFEKK